MSSPMFELDDNWGSVEEAHYPALPTKEKASKTVQKRRNKAAKKVLSMSSTAVLPATSKPAAVAVEGDSAAAAGSVEPTSHLKKKKKRKASGGDTLAAVGEQPDQPETQTGPEAGKKSGGPEAGEDTSLNDQAREKKKRKKKRKVEDTKPADPMAADQESTPVDDQRAVANGGADRPDTPASSPIQIAQPGSGGRSGQGGAAEKPRSHSSKQLDQMTARLSGSKFRWLNEELYTSTGKDAFELMQGQPDLFHQYHQGFQQQTKHWPEQPLDAAIRWLKKQPKKAKVADFGCGDAGLAKAASQQVASLDLVAASPEVTACDMSATPLGTGSMDVVVFCLALMGTDYPSFLREATRVLKPAGKLWIAEVRSRFVQGGQESFEPFLAAVQGLGYRLTSQDVSNKMFVVFELQKAKTAMSDAEPQWPELKPCLYKRR